MKNRKLMFLIIMIILFIPNLTYAENAISGEYGTYEDAIKIIQEVMKLYYIKGDRIQYSSSRAWKESFPPEEGTYQDNHYLVCSAFASYSHNQAFGAKPVKGSASTLGSTANLLDLARDYYNKNKNTSSKLKGQFLLYYQKNNLDNNGIVTKVEKKYVYNDNDNIKKFACMLQPGDVIAVTGHTMIVYGVYKSGNDCDALVLHSATSGRIPSNLNGTTKVFYDMFPANNKNNKLDTDVQGTIKYFMISNKKYLLKDKKLNCDKEECAIIRFFYNKNGKAYFNEDYPILESNYKNSKLRLDYPGMIIDKTVDKVDNNSVYLDDTLTYSINITNKSSVTNKGADKKKYGSFVVKETIDSNLVSLVNCDNSCTKSGNELIWTVNSLQPDSSKKLKYTVKIKSNNENVQKKISSVGKVCKNSNCKAYITTGTVENTILAKPINHKSYITCYNNKKNSASGLSLINEVYKCSHGVDLHFDKFEFTKLFSKKTVYKKSDTDAITFQKSMDNTTLNFKNMILNNLWSGVASFVQTSTTDDEIDESDDGNSSGTAKTYYVLPRWGKNDQRVQNILPGFFKDGDVLIYYPKSDKFTKERGMYAYIYINGKFVGVNGKDKTIRNEFTYHYYADSNKIDSYYKDKAAGKDATYKYDEKSSELNLYYNAYNYNVIPYERKDEILTYLNYQSLYIKDYYVILRPEIVLKEESTQQHTLTNTIAPVTTVKPSTPEPVITVKPSTPEPVTTVKPSTPKPVTTEAPATTTAPVTTVAPQPPTKKYLEGDVDGNGLVQSIDYILIRNHVFNTKKLTDDKFQRADLNFDGNVTSLDFITLKKIIWKLM